jgi:hypothetical protein
MRSFSAAMLARGDGVGLAHADDLVRRQRAGAQAALVAAAVDQGFEAHARLAPHVERADALGAVGLVGRQDIRSMGSLRQVDLHLAGGLGGIHVVDHALGAAQGADGGHVLDHADLVVHIHGGHQHRVRAHGGGELASRSIRPLGSTSR